MDKKKLETLQPDIISGDVVVLAQDEVHLLWGDLTGYVWGKKAIRISIPMTNFRYSQTYYGSLNLFNHCFHIHPYEHGNSSCTILYLDHLRSLYPDKRLVIIWDGASYHRSNEVKNYLRVLNSDLPPEKWHITLLFFEPNAPEQNPVEDVWLRGKNHIRSNFLDCLSFSKTKSAFTEFLSSSFFNFEKIKWYTGNLQII